MITKRSRQQRRRRIQQFARSRFVLLFLLLSFTEQCHGFAMMSPLDFDWNSIQQALVALQNTAAGSASAGTGTGGGGVVAPSAALQLQSSVLPLVDDFLFAAVNAAQQQPTVSTLDDQQQKQQQQQQATKQLKLLYTKDSPSVLRQRQSLSPTIRLTRQEQALFQLILQVRKEHAPSTTIRIAGGWVRDKLLQQGNDDDHINSSHDIDFVLSNQSGSEFARLLYDYIKKQQGDHLDLNISLDTSPSSTTTSTTTQLKEYKDTKSQHLQTASLNIGDFELDFCQMRCEKYERKNSRVPSSTGRAQAVQDAFRRDLTINALYYNMNTNEIEDWTERGMEDLLFGNLATPTPPRAALLQDPLRILRSIRFASQLSSSFSLDPALMQAGSDVQIHDALRRKVSAVRMGKEVNGIFSSADPTRGVGLLLVTKLVDTVFAMDAPSADSIYMEGYQLLFRTQTLASRIFSKNDVSVAIGRRPEDDSTSTSSSPAAIAAWDTERRRYLWYAAFLKPFHDAFSTSTSSSRRPEKKGGNKRQRRQESILNKLLVQQLGRPTRDVESIQSIIQGANDLQILLRRYGYDERKNYHQNHGLFQEASMLTAAATAAASSSSSSSMTLFSSHDHRFTFRNAEIAPADMRLACYKVLKRIGPLWKESLLLALALSTDLQLAQAVDLFQSICTLVEERLGLNMLFFDDSKKARKMPLMIPPLLNGSDIQQRALVNLQSGPAFRKIMQAQEEWQVRHCWAGDDDESSADDDDDEDKETALIEYLVQTFPEYA